MADDVFPVMRIKILIPQLTVWDFVTDNEVCRLQNTVCDHDGCAFLAFPTGKPTKFSAEIRPFRVARGVRTFDEDRPQPLVAFAGPPAFALPGTLIVPRADLGPGAEMLGGGKPRHIDPNFRDEILRRPLADARDRVQQRDDLGERAA